MDSRRFISVPGPAADCNGINVSIDVPSHVVRVRNPRRVYPVPGCLQSVAHKAIISPIELAHLQADATIIVPTSDYIMVRGLSDWCDDRKMRLRTVLLAATKCASRPDKNLSAATESSLCPIECCYTGGEDP